MKKPSPFLLVVAAGCAVGSYLCGTSDYAQDLSGWWAVLGLAALAAAILCPGIIEGEEE